MKGIRSALKSLATAAGLTYGSHVLGTILSILLFTVGRGESPRLWPWDESDGSRNNFVGSFRRL